MSNDIDIHFFVCTNVKNEDPITGITPKHCAGENAVQSLKKYLKFIALENDHIEQQLSNIRINKSGCMGRCAKGPIAICYYRHNENFEQKWFHYQDSHEMEEFLLNLVS